ncbi:MAG TPA: HEAT repeat domain-containing protein, partial [Sedimentisphaerales bacterium]|nr:HEAT repeat domain-containing protein [Sedimentisphaerales bacterium]
AANGGVLNLQYDRFREAAAITLFPVTPIPGAPSDRLGEVAQLTRLLNSGDVSKRISAAQMLGVLRERSSIGALTGALKDSAAQVRRNAAFALSACGDRSAVKPLLDALDDKDVFVAQAANIAIENLTAHSAGFDPFVEPSTSKLWRDYFAQNNWAAIESSLVKALSSDDPIAQFNAAQAIGHVGSQDSAAVLRDFIARNPEAPLRTIIAAIRSLGYLRDTQAILMLTKLLHENMTKDPGASPDLHELGWLQKPVYLTATAVEALGRIGTPEAIEPLVQCAPGLLDFWQYTFWCGDHSWLMGCHSSPIHYRILEALDRVQAADIDAIVPTMLKSIPIDTDRALLHETDSYENLTARVIAKSNLSREILDTCLAVLGDPKAKAVDNLKDAVTASPPAISVLPHDPNSRAAQIASVVCLDAKYAARFRKVFNLWRALPPSRPRSWVCFYMARLLGRLGDPESIDSLLAALENDATEASFGYEDPPNVFVYKAMTPFYRAAAADALGRIDSPRAVETLIKTLTDFDNAVCVRNAAAEALLRLSKYASADRLAAIAETYPEVSTQRIMGEARRRARLHADASSQ